MTFSVSQFQKAVIGSMQDCRSFLLYQYEMWLCWIDRYKQNCSKRFKKYTNSRLFLKATAEKKSMYITEVILVWVWT